MLDYLFASSKGKPFGFDYIVMEYLGEEQRTVDLVCQEGDLLISSVKTVEAARWGVVTLSRLVDDPGLVEQTEYILSRIKLSHCANVQFIAGKLIEINARVSSYVHQQEVSFPYLALRHACGHRVDWQQAQGLVKIGRRMVRYMDQAFED
jgi:hypothetical protein